MRAVRRDRLAGVIRAVGKTVLRDRRQTLKMVGRRRLTLCCNVKQFVSMGAHGGG